MESQQLVGLAMGVIVDGKVVHVRGFGFADREAKRPVDERTMFRWASISKPLTAMRAMQLVEQGKLDLDAEVREYVPEFPKKPHFITTRQLLGHLGGIVHYRNGVVIRSQVEYESPHPFADVVVALDTFKESPLIAEPGRSTPTRPTVSSSPGRSCRRPGERPSPSRSESTSPRRSA
jgi:serine beta-lactamase-like protein LACTB